MLVRLGFSVAVHFDAPILLFDEVLAVGDAGFQQKCIKKIEELHAAGRTIILVTHDSKQVQQFCNRCIVLEQGSVIFDGSPDKAVSYYDNLF